VDSYSKWCEAFPLRTQEATEVAAVLYREVFTRFGAPRTLITDRAQNFRSRLIQALSELFSVTRHLTSSYAPQSNGAAERMNSVILQTLRAYSKGQQDDWPELLPGILMAYRATPSTQSTNLSPFFLCFGREMRLPLDTALIPKEHLSQGHREFLSSTLHNLEKSRKLAAQDIEAAQQRYKRNHDRRAQPPDFRPAQRVWLYCTKVPLGKAPKLHCKWAGPYYITQVCPKHTFRLRHCSTNKEVKSLVNARRLKHYYDPADRPTNPPLDLGHDDAELDPEEIPDPVQPEMPQPRDPQPQPNVPARPVEQPQRQAQNTPVAPHQQHRQKKPQITKPNHVNHPTTSKSLKSVDHSSNSQTSSQTKRLTSHEKSLDSHIANTKPSCQDCRRGNCKPFKSEEIEAIVSSARGNGTLYYKVKFVDKQNNPTEWYFPCKLPSHLNSEFHANRTMQGKKRKRPLQDKQHKFFEKQENAVQTVTIKTVRNGSTQTEKPANFEKSADRKLPEKMQDMKSCTQCNPWLNRPFSNITGFHVANYKPFYAIPDSSGTVKWYSAINAHRHVRDLYWELKTEFEKILQEVDIHYYKHLHRAPKQRKWDHWLDFDLKLERVLEMRTTEDSKREFLVKYKNSNISPEWLFLDEMPPALLTLTLNLIHEDYFTSTRNCRIEY